MTDQIWWRQITKASIFCDKVIRSLAEGNSIVLTIPQYMPWYDTLRNMISDGIVNSGLQRRFEDTPGNQEPGKYLLDNFCKRELRREYRVGKSYAAFLAEQDSITLNDTIVWVRCESTKEFSEWVSFVREYDRKVPESRHGALFVLEMREEDFAFPGGRHIQCISFSSEISAYDKYTFCMLVSATAPVEGRIKPYLAELVSLVCANDVELCAECVKAGVEFAENPETCLQRIITTCCRSDGSPFEMEVSKEELEYRVWESQIRMIFPLIEQFRMHFVRDHYEEILRNLPQETAFGETINEPEDAEIGLLYYLSRTGWVVLNDPAERSQLKTYKEARDSLAHITPLPFDVVREILTGKQAAAHCN